MQLLGTRERLDLTGEWQLAFDPENVGKTQGWTAGVVPGGATTVTVPAVWNVVRPGYEGVAFYLKHCSVPKAWRGKRVRLLVGAANYYTECWVNGHYVGAHEGGYTPFAFNVTGSISYGTDNLLALRVIDLPMMGEVDGLRLADVACAKETWYYRYGGIWGDVALEAGGAARCADLFVQPDPNGDPSIDVNVTIANDGPAADIDKVQLMLSVQDESGASVTRAVRALALESGETLVTLTLMLRDAIRWSTERPRIYRCQCELRDDHSGTLLDTLTVDFGMRTFDVANGEFLLNGRPIIVKGVLYQPNYPRNLVYPPTPDMAERELRMIKGAGFNLVRFHLRPPHPRYLALADRLGLLVYEETALAWIRDGPRLAKRGRQEVRETIQRDRNHPSVVLWGVFNENQKAARAAGEALMRYARELDPTRPVIDNSGGTAAIDQGGSWSDETRVLSVREEAPRALNDLHLYFGAPVAPEVQQWLTRAGGRHRLPSLVRMGYGTPSIDRALRPRLVRDGKLFVSELGYGGLPDFEEVAAAYGEESGLVDGTEVRTYRDSLAAGVVARGLDNTFGGIVGLIAAAQEIQARGDVRQVDALRGNPRVSGYVVTQFNDAAWECHAGLVDLWRQPKRALAALGEVNQPRRLILSPARHAVAEGEEMRVAWMLVDEGPPLGYLHRQLALWGKDGMHWSRELTPARATEPVTVLPSCLIRCPETAGEYTLRASIWRGDRKITTVSETITVLEKVDWPAERDKVAGRIALAVPDRRVTALCGNLTVGIDGNRPMVLVSQPGAVSSAQWVRLAAWVREGGRAVIFALTPRSAEPLSHALGLARPLQTTATIGCFMGWFHYVKQSFPFRGLPANCLAGDQYALLMPHFSLDELGDTIYAGALSSGRDEHSRGRFVWRADVQSMPLGRGTITFCQYRIRERLGTDAVAATLLRNLLLEG